MHHLDRCKKDVWEMGGSQLWLIIRVIWVLWLGPSTTVKVELLEGGLV